MEYSFGTVESMSFWHTSVLLLRFFGSLRFNCSLALASLCSWKWLGLLCDELVFVENFLQ